VVLCYDLLRRRHSLSKSNLIASRESWNVTRPLLESLTDERLANAANQVAQHKPVTDAGVKKLLGMINSIGSTAPGSEEKKSYELAQLKSSVVHFGAPVIYLTFNPGENSSPIALLYAGEDIDVKAFSPQLYTVGGRLKTMLDNPLAVVEYFHNTINTIIQTLLKGGMFGDLVHHYGPVEYLGRGPPHTHLVVYILEVCTLLTI
jgi:hypothetical protein